jgi:hypothetical protein
MMDAAFCSLLVMMAVQGLKEAAVTGPPSIDDPTMVLHMDDLLVNLNLS